MKEGYRNRSSNRIVEYNGERHPLIVFVERGVTKLNYGGTRRRIARGWSVKKAFETDAIPKTSRKEVP